MAKRRCSHRTSRETQLTSHEAVQCHNAASRQRAIQAQTLYNKIASVGVQLGLGLTHMLVKHIRNIMDIYQVIIDSEKAQIVDLVTLHRCTSTHLVG